MFLTHFGSSFLAKLIHLLYTINRFSVLILIMVQDKRGSLSNTDVSYKRDYDNKFLLLFFSVACSSNLFP